MGCCNSADTGPVTETELNGTAHGPVFKLVANNQEFVGILRSSLRLNNFRISKTFRFYSGPFVTAWDDEYCGCLYLEQDPNNGALTGRYNGWKWSDDSNSADAQCNKEKLVWDIAQADQDVGLFSYDHLAFMLNGDTNYLLYASKWSAAMGNIRRFVDSLTVPSDKVAQALNSCCGVSYVFNAKFCHGCGKAIDENMLVWREQKQ